MFFGIVKECLLDRGIRSEKEDLPPDFTSGERLLPKDFQYATI